MKNVLLALVTCAIVTAVAMADVITDPEKINALVAGKTTSEDVAKTLGAPAHEDHNPDGRFVYIYEFKLPVKDDPSKPPASGKIALLFGPDHKLIRRNVYADPTGR